MRGRGFIIRNSGGGSSQQAGTGNLGGSGLSLLGHAGLTSGGSAPSLLGLSSAGLVGVGGGNCHRPDIFRSRPQNTSRPPSLHVDDFNKLEKADGASGANGTSCGSNEASFHLPKNQFLLTHLIIHHPIEK